MIDRLVLYDIDGTLITTGRAGLRGMNAAVARLHGRDNALDGISFAGRTDRAIVTDIYAAMGIGAGDAEIESLRDAYLEHLQVEIRKPVADSGVLPGVLASLAALQTRTNVGVGLLTGNFARGAEIKLGHFGLWERFAFGAFGDAHADRRRLVPVAIDEARRAIGANVPSDRVVVIGDTPLDVDCARAHGAIAVAVATGPFGVEELSASGPDLVLETLEDVETLVGLIDRLS